MKVRLMKVYNRFLMRKVWVPRELYDSSFVGYVSQQNDWIRHQVKMAHAYNHAEAMRYRYGDD